MAIIKWKDKVYSITVAWPLILIAIAVFVGVAIMIIGTARDYFAR